MTHICVGKLTIIGSDNGLSPGRRQAIIWTNAGILLIGPLGTNFSEILIAIEAFSFKKMHLKISSTKWRPFGLGLNVLKTMPFIVFSHCLTTIAVDCYTVVYWSFQDCQASNWLVLPVWYDIFTPPPPPPPPIFSPRGENIVTISSPPYDIFTPSQ